MKRRILTALAGIAAAFLAGFLLLTIQGYPAARGFFALFSYSLLSPQALFNTLYKASPLILTGLSAAAAFGAGVVNLGQPGQFLIGAVAVTVLGIHLPLPPVLMIPVLILSALAAGAFWSGIAGLLKKQFGMDEFITTLMLNFLAKFLTDYLITGPLRDKELYSAMSVPIRAAGWIASPGGFPLVFLVSIAAFLAVLGYWNTTKSGYEMRMMGLNALFTRTGGCRNRENFTRAVLLSGALAGLSGALLILGGLQHRFLKGMEANYGWDGVMIAIVAGSSIGAAGIYALFFAVLQTGAMGMELETAVPSEFVLVFQAVTVLFVVAIRESAHILIHRTAAALTARKARKAQPPQPPQKFQKADSG